ncbi:AAA family ATPase [Kribbella yunnanensis]|uniref:AAA family ATPase n=1 Tax=Kribbella yunnanensis TaxID=190194 RepID=A0ABN2IV03_9ACTN
MADLGVRRSGADIFVGRRSEQAQLHTALLDVRSGRGRVCLLSGQAGIGKTGLATLLSTAARESGARVLWGRCWEDGGAPAYWPWVQILRGLVTETDERDLAEFAGTAVPLARLLPELADYLPSSDPGRKDSIRTDDERFQLFDSITRFMARAAAGQPVVIVIDDAHAADEPSLLLLRFVARDIWSVPILLLVAYRDDATTPDDRLGLLSTLEKECTSLQLGGLSPDEVHEYLADTGPGTPSVELAGAVHEATGGNPFLLGRIARRLAETADERTSAVPLPDDLRDLLRGQLRPLPSDTRRILGYASVLGRVFELTTLRYLVHRSDHELASELQSAVGAGIVHTDGSGTYRFAHGLLQQTAYADLPLDLRGSLHRRVGEVLEGRYSAEPEMHATALAHHFVAAIRCGQPTEALAHRALDYSVRAARRASQLLAYEEAETHYEQALAVLDRTLSGTPDQRCDLLLALGSARRRAGRLSTAQQAYREAAVLARSLGSADRLVRAALGFGGGRFEFGTVDREQIDLLEEALATTPAPVARVRLLARLAVALYFTTEQERRIALAHEAVLCAAELSDPAVLGIALSARHFASWGPDTATERLADTEQLIAIARRAENQPLILEGRVWRIVDLLELGEIRSAFAEMTSFDRLATELRMPIYRWYADLFAAQRALLASENAEAEGLAAQARQSGHRAGARSADLFFSTQIYLLRREQGRLAELEDVVVRMVDQFPAMANWRAALTLLYAELGKTDQALRELDALFTRELQDLPRDANWPVVTALLAEVCTILGDEARARLLYDALLPFAHRIVVVASAVACLGPVAYYLGRLATVLGEHESAVAHFTEALEVANAADAGPWRTDTLRELAALSHPAPPYDGSAGQHVR